MLKHVILHGKCGKNKCKKEEAKSPPADSSIILNLGVVLAPGSKHLEYVLGSVAIGFEPKYSQSRMRGNDF